MFDYEGIGKIGMCEDLEFSNCLFVLFLYICLSISTGMGCKQLKPLLGLVDPFHAKYMPKNVAAYTGLDVLWYANNYNVYW